MSYLVTISRGGIEAVSVPCDDTEAARVTANEGWSDPEVSLIIIVNRDSGVSSSWDRRPKKIRKRYR